MPSSPPSDLGLAARSIAFHPTEAELRSYADAMPQARQTEYGNVNVQTEVVSRSKGSTYLVTDRPDEHSDQTIDREEGKRLAALQDDYIRGQDMLVVDGFVGHAGPYRTPARLVIEKANANIAGMQRFLYYDPVEGDTGHEPEITIVYTPNLAAPGYPDDRVVAVDLDAGVTRVLNSDYFGESKKGGLRMWNRKVYEGGGLAMHAGCKVIPTSDGEKTMLIVGLSGTGKTTTTFTKQNGSQAVQDDFIGLFAGGSIVSTEAGCFMLGETQGTSAGGKDEEGKSLRVPGTNPFFPLRHEQQGNRLAELLETHPLGVFLLNTGRVGGPDGDDRSKKVRIPHSSAIVRAIAEGSITWDDDPDFGYQVAAEVPGIDDRELLQPRRLYERQGRSDEYRRQVERLKAERAEYLAQFPGLDEAIVKAVS